MYEAAIQALLDRQPEQAIRLIEQSMRDVQKSSECFELELTEAVDEIDQAQEFLCFDEWRNS